MSRPPPTPPVRPLHTAGWMLLVVGVVCGLYVPAALSAAFVVDDWALLARHAHPGDIAGEWAQATQTHATGEPGSYTWRPLTASLHQVVGEVFGRTPAAFRLLNVALHALNALLLAAVGRRLGASAAIASLWALAWAIHPILTDAVCWSSDTYDLLVATFLLAAARLALAERPAEPARVAGTAGLVLLALLAKESALAAVASLPLAVLFLRNRREAMLHGLALVVIAVAHGAWHRAVVGTAPGDFLVWPDLPALWSDYAAWFLTMPVDAGMTHLAWRGQTPFSALGVGLALGGAAVCGLLARRGVPAAAPLAAALTQWFVLLAPAAAAAVLLGTQPTRYLYAPSALALAFLGGVRLTGASARLAATIPVLGFAGWFLAWLPRTVVRTERWRDEPSLLLAEARAEPENPVAVGFLGRWLVANGKAEEGLRLWRFALLNPPPTSYFMDLQAQRLAYARAALDGGFASQADEQLRAYVAEEAAAGRPLAPDASALVADVARAAGP